MLQITAREDRLDLGTPERPTASNESTNAGFSQAVGRYALIKKGIDRFISSVLFIALAPLLAVIVAITWLTSRGPVIYRQERVGRWGQTFIMYKIRTMIVESEKESGPLWCQPDDRRITRFGRILRKTHLDELPQLWNVLRGEMSLIGPRPERPEFVAQLELAIPRYRERLAVCPGLTGLAQISLPADIIEDDVRRKLVYDLHYIQYRDLLLDLRILLSTGLFLLGVPFITSRSILRLPDLQHHGAEPLALPPANLEGA